MNPIVAAFLATLMTYVAVLGGSSLVMCTSESNGDHTKLKWPLAVAGGFMLSAAMELAEEGGGIVPGIVGSLLALVFYLCLDSVSDYILDYASGNPSQGSRKSSDAHEEASS